MPPIAAALMSLAMLAAALLLGVGILLARKAEQRRHGMLMIVAGVVLIGNVVIWAV